MVDPSFLIGKCCPFCGRTFLCAPRRGRVHDDGEEFFCWACGHRFTLKEGDTENIYPFFPGAIAEAFGDQTIKPFLPDALSSQQEARITTLFIAHSWPRDDRNQRKTERELS